MQKVVGSSPIIRFRRSTRPDVRSGGTLRAGTMATDSTTASSSLRELREEDAAEVAALFRAVYGESRLVDADEVESWVANPELDPAWLRVLEVDGRIVGYGDIQITGDAVAVDVAAPEHWQTFCDW